MRNRSSALPLFCMSFQANNSICLCLFSLATISSILYFILGSSLLHFWSLSRAKDLSSGLTSIYMQSQCTHTRACTQENIKAAQLMWEGRIRKWNARLVKIEALVVRLSGSPHPWMSDGPDSANANNEFEASASAPWCSSLSEGMNTSSQSQMEKSGQKQ